jgi:ketosteroid isomerase-like protein
VKTTSTLIAITAIVFGVLLLSRPRTSVAAQSVESGTATANSLEQQIVSHEREGLDALKVGDVDHFGSLTADDAVLVDAHGPAPKAQVLKNIAGFRLTDYSMDDVRFVPLSATSGLIVYKITEKGVSHSRDFAVQAYISSIWAQRGDKWVCLFSQETGAR